MNVLLYSQRLVVVVVIEVSGVLIYLTFFSDIYIVVHQETRSLPLIGLNVSKFEN